jgi:hypothetical protein
MMMVFSMARAFSICEMETQRGARSCAPLQVMRAASSQNTAKPDKVQGPKVVAMATSVDIPLKNRAHA